MLPLAFYSRTQSVNLRHLPTNSAAWPALRRCVLGSPRTRSLKAAARADTVPVWETLVVVHNAVDRPQTGEEQQELLDTLWSLQYRTPGACCASAGPVVQAASRPGPSPSASYSTSTARAAVYYRFSSQAQAERFVAGPAFADAKARLLGSGTVSLSLWKVLVPNDMEAIFKRGPAFETGVDLVLVMQPASAPAGAGTEAADAAGGNQAAGAAAAGAPPALQPEVLVEVVGRMQAAAMAAGSVQVSCGADVMSMDPRFVWMARFPQEAAAQQFLRSPVVTELASGMGTAAAAASGGGGGGGGSLGGAEQQQASPLVLTSMAMIEVGAVQQSKQGM